MFTRLTLLAAAGALGTLARYCLGGLVQRYSNVSFPGGTLVVNAVGCCLFGLVWAWTEERLQIRGEARFIVLTGFTGAFTTFSAFAFETSHMLRDAQWLLAAANIAAQNIIGILFIFAGFALGRLL